MSHPLPAASVAAQQKSYVTYTSPCTSISKMQITLLESPALLAQAGTTGFRTWEAALYLASFLSSAAGKRYYTCRSNILELGAGTGLISIMCAKYFGVSSVLATDGSNEVIRDLNSNISINGLQTGKIKSSTLHWGHALIGGAPDSCLGGKDYNLVLGADVV